MLQDILMLSAIVGNITWDNSNEVFLTLLQMQWLFQRLDNYFQCNFFFSVSLLQYYKSSNLISLINYVVSLFCLLRTDL